MVVWRVARALAISVLVSLIWTAVDYFVLNKPWLFSLEFNIIFSAVLLTPVFYWADSRGRTRQAALRTHQDPDHLRNDPGESDQGGPHNRR
jgi:hypothetical protein